MLNPIRSPERAFARRNVVLGRMLETGKITQAQFDEASKMPVKARYHGAEITLNAPYLGRWCQKMVEQFGEDAYTMGLHVYTTVTASASAPPGWPCSTAYSTMTPAMATRA